jgi:hypothetical protein
MQYLTLEIGDVHQEATFDPAANHFKNSADGTAQQGTIRHRMFSPRVCKRQNIEDLPGQKPLACKSLIGMIMPRSGSKGRSSKPKWQ